MNTLGCLKLMSAVFGADVIQSITEQWLNNLSAREKRVLVLRFGLQDEDDRARTLEEVGKEFSVSRERIRQVEAKALRNIRSQIGATEWFYGIFLNKHKALGNAPGWPG